MSVHQLGVLLISGRLTHQENYALNLRADPRCALVGLSDEADVDPARAQLNRQFAEDMEIPYWPNLDDALAREDVHLVSICAEPERRGRIVARCADAGKHVYIDKPMTPYLADADAAVAAVERAGVRSQMFSSNHQAWVQRARQAVESGELGDLVAIHVDNLFAKGPGGSATLGAPRRTIYPPVIANFVDAKAELYAMGVYALGLVCLISGAAVETVYGGTGKLLFRGPPTSQCRGFRLSLADVGGRRDRDHHRRGAWDGRATRPAAPNQLYLIGTRGSLLVDANRPRLEIYTSAPPWTPPPVNPRDPMGFWRTGAGRGQRPTQTHSRTIWQHAGQPQRCQPLHRLHFRRGAKAG